LVAVWVEKMEISEAAMRVEYEVSVLVVLMEP